MSASEEIDLHFIKSSQFRTIHCDGILGTQGSDWTVLLTLFSERPAIPQKMVVTQNEDGQLEEVNGQREGKTGMVRDVEANVVLTLDAAIGLYDWLKTFLEDAHQNEILDLVEKDA